MGEAKRRGSFEQRKAQSVVRRTAEEARRAEERARMAAERRRQASERQKLLSPQERKEAVLTVGGGYNAGLLLAAIMGMGAGLGGVVRPSERVLLLDDAPTAAVESSQGEPK